MMGGWWLLMAIVWIALIAVIVWAGLSVFGARQREELAPERPEEILDRRLARGEIDAATYDELRARLRAARVERS